MATWLKQGKKLKELAKRLKQARREIDDINESLIHDVAAVVGEADMFHDAAGPLHEAQELLKESYNAMLDAAEQLGEKKKKYFFF